jgi:hypothetical protein
MRKTFLLTHTTLFLILCCGACVKVPEPTQSKPIAQISPTTQNTPTPQKSEIKPLIDFFSLTNKSVAAVEKIYGKPSLVDTKFVQLKDGEYRIYNKSGKRHLQVDYFKGKAVAFYLDIPEEWQTTIPEEALRLCSLDLRVADAQTEAGGFWWDNPSSAKPFYIVRISRFNDSGLYHNCEAHIKVN